MSLWSFSSVVLVLVLQVVSQTTKFPSDTCNCTGGCTNPVAGVVGLCQYLDNAPTPIDGCCTDRATSPSDLPVADPVATATTGCTPKCLSLYYSFWCVFPCMDAPADVTICETELQELYDACNSCEVFGTTWAFFNEYKTALINDHGVQVSNTVGCINFKSQIPFPEEDREPVVDTITFAPASNLTFTGASSQTITGTIPVLQPTNGGISNPPVFAIVSFVDPNGNHAAQRRFDAQDFIKVGNNWEVTHSITLGWKAYAGDWRLSVNSVVNTYDRADSTNTNGKFALASSHVPGAFGNIGACSSDRLTPTGRSADDAIGSNTVVLANPGDSINELTCCDVGSCTLKCEVGSGSHAVNSLAHATPAPSFTVNGCTVTVATGPGWVLPQTTVIEAASVLTFTSTTLTMGEPSSKITGTDASLVTIGGGGVFNVNSNTASLDTDIDVAPGGELRIPDNSSPPGTYFATVGGNAWLKVSGLLKLTNAGSRLTIDSTATKRETLHVVGVPGTTNSGTIECQAPAARIEIKRGRLEANSGANINCDVFVGAATTPSKAPKLLTQATSNPADFAAEVCCGSVCGNTVTVRSLAALFIVPPDGSTTGCSLPTNALISATINNQLVMEANSRLVLGRVHKDGPVFNVGTMDIRGRITIEVELSGPTSDSRDHDITVIRFTSNIQNPGRCNINAVMIFTGQDPQRPPTQSCKTNGTLHTIVVSIPAAQAVTTAGGTGGGTGAAFVSLDSYSIAFNKDIAEFTQADFLATLQQVSGVHPNFVQVDSYVQNGDGIRATFRCRATTSQQAADAVCRDLVQAANEQGTALNERLNTVSTQVNESDDDGGSNTALYGLFALLLIPILLILAFVVFSKMKSKRADNQYMQDTATFSNVAAAPQPINYPHPLRMSANEDFAPVVVNDGPHMYDSSPIVAGGYNDMPAGYWAN